MKNNYGYFLDFNDKTGKNQLDNFHILEYGKTNLL